ncbi:RTA1-domain-containing protein [Cucurbitaria berberidis CBS 394.84]|uniref:RTA1-domain-containing protein n=1 Tax=Cucurbitaria berberidis CBS 394.84 TaxID=1168544 RepID=A0A9P4L3D7_9PLEO|nr:RTA1-domain-containing protein [Cucurbitaria berberidis CBS 394.84]KAF1840184.1 RTA1-domain-containing protein [Cucurbitaria berberidis CBS 394.84]
MRSVARTTLLASLAFALQFIVVEAATDRPKGDFRKCLEISSKCPVEATLYGYYPKLGANAFFTALFGICFIATIAIGIRTKTWTYTLALGIGTFLEAAGYIGRVIMNGNPWSESGFKLQICCLVLGPSFVAAAIYLTLKHFVLYCGPQHSLIRARLYPWIFIGCDFGSIVLQACGGGMAAAGGTNNKKLIDAGNNLIVAGIAFQVVTMAVCGSLVLVYIIRYRKARSMRAELSEKSSYELDKEQGDVRLGKVKLFGAMIVLAYTTVLIRCIYRLPEMAGGWGNALMRNETEFLLLDGMMLGIACVVLTFFHPAYFFPPFAAFRQRK